MRTFHTGGVAGEDITHGLPRVTELFEARIPKNKALIKVDGKELKDGDAVNVVAGTHKGKSGTVEDSKLSKTGAATITGSMTTGVPGGNSASTSTTASIVATVPSIPILTASTPMSVSTARTWAMMISGGTM